MIAATLAVQVEGCASPTRLTRHMEAPVPDEAVRRYFKVSALPEGAEVILVLRDGTVRSGTYRGLGRLESGAYSVRFAPMRAEHAGEAPLPAPGDSISLLRAWGRPHSGRLVGYGFRSLELIPGPGRRSESVPFDRLQSLADSAGNTWPADSLVALAERGRVPTFAVFDLEKPSGRQQVPLDEIETVAWRSEGGGEDWVIGVLLIAGVVALVLVIGLYSALNNIGSGCASIPAPNLRTYPPPPGAAPAAPAPAAP